MLKRSIALLRNLNERKKKKNERRRIESTKRIKEFVCKCISVYKVRMNLNFRPIIKFK